MDNYIIKGAGTATEICEKLRILRAIFPKGATLAEVESVTRQAIIKTAVRKQIEEIERGLDK